MGSLGVRVNSELQYVGSSSLTMEWTKDPALGARSLSPWATKEVLVKNQVKNLVKRCQHL